MSIRLNVLEPAIELLDKGDAEAAYGYLKPIVAVGIESAKPLLASAATELDLPALDNVQSTDGEPPILWSEVPNHLMRRLLMDPQWMVQEEGQLSWWPWFLEQSFTLTHAGFYDAEHDVDPWFTVTANIDIARSVPEEIGLELASEVNNTFPLGAVVYEDSTLSMRSTLTLGGLNRNMLRWFHEAVLAQATVAHQVALDLQERDVEVCESHHPANGLRTHADEMLGFFAGPDRKVPAGPDLVGKIRASRPQYLQELVALGSLTPGWSNDEVDFLTLREEPLLDVAIALPADDADNARYGSGIRLYVRVLPPGRCFRLQALNFVNLDLLSWGPLTMLGNVRSDELSEHWGSYYCTYITSGALEESSNIEARGLAVEVTNAVLHSLGPARVVQDVFMQEPSN